MSSPFVHPETKEKTQKAKEKHKKGVVMKKGQCYSKVMEKKDET
jgi:hypothetical protein